MKKIVLFLAFVFVVNIVSAQSVSSANEKMPLPVGQSPIIAFMIPATQTQVITLDTATQIGTLPAGTKGVIVVAYNGVVNYGNASVSTGLTWPSIASGATKEFIVTPLNTSPMIYFCNQTAGATASVRLVPYK